MNIGVTFDMNVDLKLDIRNSDLIDIGNVAKLLVIDRTNKGYGEDAKPFKPYSTEPMYVSKSSSPYPKGGVSKKKTRYYPGGYRQYKKATTGSSKVDLHLSGRMFMGYTVKASLARMKSTLYFRGTEAKDKASYVQETRPFVGIYKRSRDFRRLVKGAQEIVELRFLKKRKRL